MTSVLIPLTQDLTTILRGLGYYDERVLAEGDILVGARCERNGCTVFKVGDKVHPYLISTTERHMYRHAGMHVEHTEEALRAVKDFNK